MAKRKDFRILAKINHIPSEEAELIYLEPGNRVGPNNRYEIIHLIGTGSIGAVYLVKDYEEKESLFALKMILPDVLQNEKELDIFIDYISQVQELKHPNLLQIHDFWKQNTLYFYTMEYVDGHSLRDMMDEQRERKEIIPLKEACEMAIKMCNAIEFVHFTGHYRLHPENVLLAGDFKKRSHIVKLCDFGMYPLKPSSFWKEASFHLGYLPYMPPELSEGGADVKSDIFSIAALLYEMIYEAPPQTNELPPRREVPGSLRKAISCALEKDPSKRPPTITSLVEPLEYFLESVSTKEPQTRKKPRPVQKNAEEEREEWIKKAKELLEQKRYPQAIEEFEKANAQKADPKIEEWIAQNRLFYETAIQLKEQAKQARQEIYQKHELLKKSLEIYPHDLEAQALLKGMESDIGSLEMEVAEILQQGDQWVEKHRYEEAVLTWKKGLFPSSRNKEIRDRIMQVIDMVGESARAILDQGNPYLARENLRQVVAHTQDTVIRELENEIQKEIQERESRVAQAMGEAEKHVEKNQFPAAIEIWKSVIGISPEKDEILLRKIEKSKAMMDALERDEKEYLQMVTTARALEKREDYRGALQAFERIRQKEVWACPISDPTPDIERMTKMVAASAYAQESSNLLNEASKALQGGKLGQASEILGHSLFTRKMIPSIEARYQSLTAQLEENLKRRKTVKRIILVSSIVILVIAAVVLGIALSQ